MTSRPSPPPEAVLIRLAREAARIKAPVAARAAGISTARWSQVETGYETRLGNARAVRAPSGTLAHMAHAVGISPERLEEAGRPDAAAVLREILRGDGLPACPDGQPARASGDEALAEVLTADERQILETYREAIRAGRGRQEAERERQRNGKSA